MEEWWECCLCVPKVSGLNPNIGDFSLQKTSWPNFVSLHYWRSPRCVNKSGWPNWNPFWWVGALKFSQNWRHCEKPSELNKVVKKNPVFWRFFEFHSILAKSKDGDVKKVKKWGKVLFNVSSISEPNWNTFWDYFTFEAMYVPYFDPEGGFKIEVRAQVDIKSGEEITIRWD